MKAGSRNNFVTGKCPRRPEQCSKARSGEVQRRPAGEPNCSECGTHLLISREPRPVLPYLAAAGAGLAALLVAVVSLVPQARFWHHAAPDASTVARSSPSATTPAQAEQLPTETGPRTLLRLAGSNTMGPDLVPALVQAYLRARGASDITRSEPAADEIRIGARLDNAPVQVTIAAKGSDTGFPALRDGLADIADASREIAPEEEAMLHDKGVARSVGSEHVVALDGIAVIVHVRNTLNSISVEDLRGLFTGTLNWPDLGLTGPVHLYARDKHSGTWQVFCDLVLLGKCDTLSARADPRHEDSRKLVQGVAGDPFGIGFVAVPFVAEGRGDVKALAVAGAGNRAIPASAFTIRTETYPLMRRLYMYVPTPPAPETAKFLQFVQSTEGQRVVEERGFVSLDLQPQATDIGALGPRYRELFHRIGPFEQISTSIRFQVNSSVIDPRGETDLAQVPRMLREIHRADRKILVIGHADPSGTRKQNCDLSLDRARAVHSLLQEAGLQLLEPEGFCADAPVTDDTSDASDASNQRNRRAEIWMQE